MYDLPQINSIVKEVISKHFLPGTRLTVLDNCCTTTSPAREMVVVSNGRLCRYLDRSEIQEVQDT